MKKIFLLTSLIFGLILAAIATILVQPGSGTVFVGENIGIQVDCIDYCDANIRWGDGQASNGVDEPYGFWLYHQYKNPGQFTIQFTRYNWITTPFCLVNEYRTVSVLENRLITASCAKAYPGQVVTFTAMNFQTPRDITWDMGDGATYAHQGSTINHTYASQGTYTVRAFDWKGDTRTTPVTLAFTVVGRVISVSPETPRADQLVTIQALGFNSTSIDWNFGDGTPAQTAAVTVTRRFANPGTFTITAKEHGQDIAPASKVITVLADNRSLAFSSPNQEIQVNDPVKFSARNFRGPLVLWNFGDGTSPVSGPKVITHTFTRPGNFIVTAKDENGQSNKTFQAQVKILGISDEINLAVAEIALDNGKYYKVIPRKSKNIKAILRMKMRGTGIVSGYWIVDGQPYEFFNETVYQGQVKDIPTKDTPGLPVFDPGMHTVTVQLTRPADGAVVFPTLRYFVLPFDNVIETLTPVDGAIVKEDAIPAFSWREAPGGSYYQIVFANSLLPLMQADGELKWRDCRNQLSFTPDAELWKSIRRNQWSYWQVRATDSGGNVVAESSIQEMKVIIIGAAIGIQKLTDMDGNDIAIGSGFTSVRSSPLLVQGYVAYPGDAEYLILQVYANNELLDQLLFRDVKKEEKRIFETSIPNTAKESRIVFQVLKSSSPSVLIGLEELTLKKDD